jgi:hypothetical protein
VGYTGGLSPYSGTSDSLVYPCETARFGSRAKLTAAALEYLILQIFRFRQYVCSSWNHTRLNTSENFTRISRLTTLETSFGKTTGFHCDLVTSPLQCYRSLQPFSAFRLGGEGRADTSVDGCCVKDGRPDCCRERLAPAAISSSRRPALHVMNAQFHSYSLHRCDPKLVQSY